MPRILNIIASINRRFSTTKSIPKSKFATKFAIGCGIVGFVGNEPAQDYIFEGLHILRSRGYDSAGITTISEDPKTCSNPKQSLDQSSNGFNKKTANHSLKTTKFASINVSDSFDLVKKAAQSIHSKNFCGIGHTRWATHGGKTDINAHPHTDQHNRIAVVHNGTIENFAMLKKELQSENYRFVSDTDTEVIAQLISFFYDSEQKNLVAAVRIAASKLQGTYGLAILCRDLPGRIIALRHGSPLVIGLSENKKWIASESSAFSRHTKKYVSLKDGEIAVVTKDGCSLDIEGRIKHASKEENLMDPSPFSHWTIKEIKEQPAAIDRALNNGGRISKNGVKLGGLYDKKEVLKNVQNLVICACGSSYFASLYAAKIIRTLRCFDTVQVEIASEFEFDIFPKNCVLLAVSQSGETRDLINVIDLAKDNDIVVISIVNVVGSLITAMTKCGVYTNAGRELAVPSTKSFTSQIVVMLLVGLWFASIKETDRAPIKRQELISELLGLSFHAQKTLETEQKCVRIARMLKDVEHVFIVGRGTGEPIAFEAALKIKEMCYIHATGLSGGEFKHGPLALIQSGTIVFAILLDDKNAKRMVISCSELNSRGAKLVIVTDNAELARELDFCDLIETPKMGAMSAFLTVLSFQLIAFHAALERGINPDKPRNLAKSVTVD